ncbi:unnamed protein product [Paramecium sonneborni]|uniref:Uncharacterized protein n=1 Tax=Paramecium sonneborni TaxID=65129 RepID=A0A8S1R8B7_9CILI|nr:unnamed protein product [Paramecium sonneborni]
MVEGWELNGTANILNKSQIEGQIQTKIGNFKLTHLQMLISLDLWALDYYYKMLTFIKSQVFSIQKYHKDFQIIFQQYINQE